MTLARPAIREAEPESPDAAVTWHTWRRILCDDRLSEQVRAGHVEPAEFGLDVAQARVAAAYAASPEGARWAIETYRYRVVSAALHALGAGAPVTTRLLRLAGLDMRDLGQAFAQERDWADDGPFVYRNCAAFLRSIAASPKCDHVAGLPEAVSFELAIAALMTQCAALPASVWPAAGGELPADPATSWYQQTGTGVAVTIARRLTPWLTSRDRLGQGELEPGTEHLLVYLTDLDHRYALYLLGDESAAVFARLAEPCSYAELAAAAPEPSALSATLASLADLGVIRACNPPAAR